MGIRGSRRRKEEARRRLKREGTVRILRVGL
jgi:hypothetical protein